MSFKDKTMYTYVVNDIQNDKIKVKMSNGLHMFSFRSPSHCAIDRFLKSDH